MICGVFFGREDGGFDEIFELSQEVCEGGEGGFGLADGTFTSSDDEVVDALENLS